MARRYRARPLVTNYQAIGNVQQPFIYSSQHNTHRGLFSLSSFKVMDKNYLKTIPKLSLSFSQQDTCLIIICYVYTPPFQELVSELGLRHMVVLQVSLMLQPSQKCCLYVQCIYYIIRSKF